MTHSCFDGVGAQLINLLQEQKKHSYQLTPHIC